jgi:predicted small metal-binding protein
MVRQFECFQEGCPFLVRAGSTDEIVHLVEEHAQYAHDLHIDRDAIEPEIERV